MIATLDSFRDTLEDLGGGLGLTDPVSGPVVLELKSYVVIGAKDDSIDEPSLTQKAKIDPFAERGQVEVA